MPEIEIEPVRNSSFHQKRDLEEKLNDPSGEDAYSQSRDRFSKEPG
jgi:hypothetical protein